MTTTRTDEWTEDVAQQMALWLHPGHLEDPEQARILMGLFRTFARALIPTYNRVIGMRDLRDPQRVPGRFLPLLGALVGLDSTAKFPGHFTEHEWRRFIPDAIGIWKRTGFDYRGLLVALLARPVLVSEWHVRKDLIEDTALPWDSFDVPGASPWPEHTVEIHVPDPYGVAVELGYTLGRAERVANRSLVAAAIGAVRPINQRVNLTWYALVDDFTQGLFQWVRTAGTQIDLVDGALVVGDRSGVVTNLGDTTTVWDRFTWDSLVTFDTDGQISLRFQRQDANNYHYVQFTATGAGAAIRLYSVTAGAAVLIASGTHELYTGDTYHVQIDVSDGMTPGSDDVTVTVDGDVVLAGAIAEGFVGGVGFSAAANEQVTVIYTEACMHPVARKRIGPQD